MDTIVFIVQTVLLLFVCVLAVFQWVYAKEARKVRQQIGIIYPGAVEKMLSLNIILPLIVAPIIMLFILLSL